MHVDPPKLVAAPPPACRELPQRSPSMGGGFIGEAADLVSLSVARPCWVDCAEPSCWGQGTPGKGAALWCLHVETNMRRPMKHVFLTNFSLTGLF